LPEATGDSVDNGFNLTLIDDPFDTVKTKPITTTFTSPTSAHSIPIGCKLNKPFYPRNKKRVLNQKPPFENYLAKKVALFKNLRENKSLIGENYQRAT